MKVLVTRPRLFADSLCKSIKNDGMTPILYPTIEIIPNPLIDFLKEQILSLQLCDLAIFCSRPAAIYGMKAIRSILVYPPRLLWMALGPGTAEELYQQGISSVLVPRFPPFESESLLALHELQDIKGKQIALFRGNEGRTVLRETLTERGANVIEIPVYQRRLPRKETLQRLTISDEGLPDVVITCSIDALKNLQILMDAKIWQALKSRPFIMVGLRMDAFAANLGIRSRILAKAAKDKEVIEALTTLRELLV